MIGKIQIHIIAADEGTGGWKTMKSADDILIAEMQISDYDEMCELWRKTSGVGLSSADKKEYIEGFLSRNKGLSYVCRHNGKIVGTIMCGHDGRRGYIYHVAVVEEYRRRGIGRKLVETSLERLKSEGIDKCHLFVIAENTIGKNFWTSMGWDRRDDIIVYSKSI